MKSAVQRQHRKIYKKWVCHLFDNIISDDVESPRIKSARSTEDVSAAADWALKKRGNCLVFKHIIFWWSQKMTIFFINLLYFIVIGWYSFWAYFPSFSTNWNLNTLIGVVRNISIVQFYSMVVINMTSPSNVSHVNNQYNNINKYFSIS